MIIDFSREEWEHLVFFLQDSLNCGEKCECQGRRLIRRILTNLDNGEVYRTPEPCDYYKGVTLVDGSRIEGVE